MIRFLLCLLLASAASAETIYVSDEEADVVHVVDGASQQVKGAIAIGRRPRGLVLLPDRRTLYVAVSNDNHIGVIDLATGKVTGQLPSGPDPETFAVSPDGRKLYVANENDNLLTVVDIPSRAIVAEIPVGGEPEGTAVSPDGHIVVQASESASVAHVVEASTGSVIDNLLVDTRPRYVAFTPDGRQFWVSSEVRGTVTIFDGATRKRLGKIDFKAEGLVDGDAGDVFVQPVGIVFTHDGKRAFIGLGRAKLVAEVDPATFKLVRTFPVGWRAWNLALSPDEAHLYTANGLTGDMSIIDLAANRSRGTVKLGGKPWGIVAIP